MAGHVKDVERAYSQIDSSLWEIGMFGRMGASYSSESTPSVIWQQPRWWDRTAHIDKVVITWLLTLEFFIFFWKFVGSCLFQLWIDKNAFSFTLKKKKNAFSFKKKKKNQGTRRHSSLYSEKNQEFWTLFKLGPNCLFIYLFIYFVWIDDGSNQTVG